MLTVYVPACELSVGLMRIPKFVSEIKQGTIPDREKVASTPPHTEIHSSLALSRGSSNVVNISSSDSYPGVNSKDAPCVQTPHYLFAQSGSTVNPTRWCAFSSTSGSSPATL